VGATGTLSLTAGTPLGGVGASGWGIGCGAIIICGAICMGAPRERLDILSLIPLSDMISIESTED
jgi:hypothetical protein